MKSKSHKCSRWEQLSELDRFARKFTVSANGCWLWYAALTDDGYPVFSASTTTRGHVFAFEHFRMPVPQGLELDHRCNNRRCVNPFHMLPVTTGENVLRGSGVCAVNSRKTACPYGHPYDGDNTYVDRTGRRHCRACNRRRNG